MAHKLFLAAAVALAPLTAFAVEDDKARTTASDKAPTFDVLDSNKDGRISMPEASADPRLVEVFSATDKNGDGYLDNAEFDSRRPPKQ